MPIPGTHLQIQDRPIDLSATEPPPNGLLTKNHYISFDPYQRGRMRDPWTSKSYSAPYEVNKPITNSAVSTVVKSANAVFGEGDVVTVFMACPTEEYSLLPGEIVTRAVQKLHNPYAIDVKHFVGTLGMAGLTAYSSMQEIAKPKAGETLFVSAASGAVGQLVGQIAKREGMKVVGSVGDEAKLEYILKDLQFDGGFNYKREKPADALGLLAPEGLDVYYDNVGGEQLDAAIQAMKPFGRIGECHETIALLLRVADFSSGLRYGVAVQPATVRNVPDKAVDANSAESAYGARLCGGRPRLWAQVPGRVRQHRGQVAC